MEQFITEEFVNSKIHKRDVNTNKNDYGRILAVCGCRGYTGAAYFAAQGAVRTGSGVVTLCVPESIYQILAIKLNEPVVIPLVEDEEGKVYHTDEVIKFAKGKDACLIGCGLGLGDGVKNVVLHLLEQLNMPIVLDADGINSIVGNINILSKTKYPVILTPHEGEFKRICKEFSSQNRLKHALKFAKENNCILLLKGHRTIIANPNGQYMINTTGNAGMAKGGSGDVLAGIIVSLLGQGFSPFDGAVLGAYIHGKAGDLCAKELGEYGMIPTDILHKIPQVLKKFDT